jgi:septal ring factor EnvC (AmiA/AmiB activator)
MTRKKKQRNFVGQFVTVESDKPTKEELLLDPTSRESLRKKGLEQKKKNKSVYQKELDKKQEERDQAAKEKSAKGGRLGDKIRATAIAKAKKEEKEEKPAE